MKRENENQGAKKNYRSDATDQERANVVESALTMLEQYYDNVVVLVSGCVVHDGTVASTTDWRVSSRGNRFANASIAKIWAKTEEQEFMKAIAETNCDEDEEL